MGLMGSKQEMVGKRGHAIAARPIHLVDLTTDELGADSVIPIEFPSYAQIVRIKIAKVSGDAANFDYAILDKEGDGSEDFDKVIADTGVTGVDEDEGAGFFVNRDDQQLEKAYLFINPASGANNIYKVKIIAEVCI